MQISYKICRKIPIFATLKCKENMKLEHLSIVNYKNIREAEIDFSGGVNCLVGNNGMGKTNLLDAIYYLSFCKSLNALPDSQVITHGEEFFMLSGQFELNGQPEDIRCGYKLKSRKSFKRGGKEYTRLSDHIGLLPIVTLTPADSELIQGGSEERRRLMDMIISQFDREYLHQLISYQKLIVQRNRLLKQFLEGGGYNQALLQIFDEQLAPLADYIHKKRASFIVEILPNFQSYYDFLSDSREKVDITYQSGLNEMSFEEGMAANALADRKSGYTNFGIHKDDFLFSINDNSVKRFGSQGQQKSFALALKLAQFDYVFAQKGIKPILLLDDIFDKLDRRRIAHLLDLVGKDHFGQVFITDTDEHRIAEILESHHIDNVIFPLSRTAK